MAADTPNQITPLADVWVRQEVRYDPRRKASLVAPGILGRIDADLLALRVDKHSNTSATGTPRSACDADARSASLIHSTRKRRHALTDQVLGVTRAHAE